MKSLCLVVALFGQFTIEELPKQEQVASVFTWEELPQPKAKVEEKPHFEFLGASWCGACVASRNAVDAIPKEKLPFTYSYRNVDSKGYLGASSIPAWAYKGKVFQYGFSTTENLMENFKRVSKPQAKATTLQRLTPQQLREFARTYNGRPYGVKGGDFWSHLQNGTTHRFTAQQLQGLTQTECAKIHAGDHYGYLTPFSIGGK